MNFSFGFTSGGSSSSSANLYGLFSEIGSSTPVTNTTVETTLIDGGLGSLTVPANGFTVGDAFRLDMLGHISSQNNRTLQIRVKANSVVLGDTGLITMPQTTAKHWCLELNFCIRALGIAGVGSIASAGVFTYSKDASNAFEGSTFVTIENTNFDTTVSNTLNITAQWGNATTANSIYTDILNLYKIY